jgi:dynein heavy chain
MESCIQQWTQQLSPMLETDESALQLERPSLTEEIAYWKNRSEDLENIFEQLKQGVVRQMAATLEAIGSAQSAVFKTLLRRVIGALAEAQEIALHMKPIVKPLDALNAADVSEMVEPLRYFDPAKRAIWPVLTAGTKLLTLSEIFILDYYLITFCDTYGNNLKLLQ